MTLENIYNLTKLYIRDIYNLAKPNIREYIGQEKPIYRAPRTNRSVRVQAYFRYGCSKVSLKR